MAWGACVFCGISSGKPLKVFEGGNDTLYFKKPNSGCCVAVGWRELGDGCRGQGEDDGA